MYPQSYETQRRVVAASDNILNRVRGVTANSLAGRSASNAQMRMQYQNSIMNEAVEWGDELGVQVDASGENGLGIAQYDPAENMVTLNNTFFSDEALSTPAMKEMIGGRTARERRKKILYHEAAHGKITGELRTAAEDWLRSGMPKDVRERLIGRLKRDFRNKKHPYWQPGGMADEIAADVIAAKEGKGMNRLKAWFGLEGEELDRLTALSDGDPVPSAAIGPFSLGDDPNDDPFWGQPPDGGMEGDPGGMPVHPRGWNPAHWQKNGAEGPLTEEQQHTHNRFTAAANRTQPQANANLLRDPNNRWNIANLDRAATDLTVGSALAK